MIMREPQEFPAIVRGRASAERTRSARRRVGSRRHRHHGQDIVFASDVRYMTLRELRRLQMIGATLRRAA